MFVYSLMTVKRNAFNTITTYEIASETAIEICATNIDALQYCLSAFLVKNLEKYMGECSLAK